MSVAAGSLFDMEMSYLLGLVTMLVIGGVLGFVVARARAAAQVVGAQAQRDAAQARATELAADRDSLADRFEVLSAEVLAEHTRQAEASAEQRLAHTETLLTPVKEGLAALNTRLGDVARDRAAMSAQLGEQVRTVQTTGETLRREANALSTALRRPQVRGAWGELQLKRVVEIAGMVEYCDFYQQASGTTSADKRIRPDMKVMLGEGKFVFVDAKVPLAAFLDAHETDDPAERADRLRQFAENVRGHIDALSGKEYWKADTGSPEFVVLFIPSEALAAEALAQRPELHEYAAARNIILATPTTLIGLLRSVAYGWKQAALADSAAEVLALGRELYDRLVTMGGHFHKLGRALQSSVQHYNSTVGSLEARVMVTARRFRDLKVTEAELAPPVGVEKSTSQLTAAELVANAHDAERELLTRGQPGVAELVASDHLPAEPHEASA